MAKWIRNQIKNVDKFTVNPMYGIYFQNGCRNCSWDANAKIPVKTKCKTLTLSNPAKIMIIFANSVFLFFTWAIEVVVKKWWLLFVWKSVKNYRGRLWHLDLLERIENLENFNLMFYIYFSLSLQRCKSKDVFIL